MVSRQRAGGRDAALLSKHSDTAGAVGETKRDSQGRGGVGSGRSDRPTASADDKALFVRFWKPLHRPRGQPGLRQHTAQGRQSDGSQLDGRCPRRQWSSFDDFGRPAKIMRQ